MRILSLGGGGIKGVCSAAFVAELEQETLTPAWRMFDMIAGTSTGGILAIALGLGIPAKKIVEFYQVEGPKIFKRQWKHRFGLIGAKYDVANLREALDDAFGMHLMQDCLSQVMVCLSDVDTLGARFVKSWQDGLVVAANAGCATSAAPTYFDAVTIPGVGNFEGGRFADGGLFANDPCLYAAIEAIKMPRHNQDEITVVNVQCPRAPAGPVRTSGVVQFAPQAIDSLMNLGTDAARHACRQLVHNYVEVIPRPTAHASGALDDASPRNVEELRTIGSGTFALMGKQVLDLLKAH